MIELLLLGILIMQVLTFHYNTIGSGRYMKYYDAIVHRLTRYLTRKTIVGGCIIGRYGKYQGTKQGRALWVHTGSTERKLLYQLRKRVKGDR